MKRIHADDCGAPVCGDWSDGGDTALNLTAVDCTACLEALPICDECAKPVAYDDLAPSCGSHRLHITCAAWFFGCRECDLVRSEVPC